ncbi:BRCT domain protein [Aspergillus clavatus NRRL 1]|uniref:BRCT domain protein n=1 Tax=Aspergillus clavatus (strain ATCC 1007 / CBS 513.65 / DSM 816 / NCTC 3887 / NRRL 1 / QM 1276 / 107) TaxID=344612 RepID=A1CPF4_ASPCL|nr:BRCT domain protein [Aspergillus clavatus NRRL 1]EAW07525.1 BRCT domain protein [Aspergillus clavatus NRRL 1]
MGKTLQKIHGCAAGKFGKDGDKIPQWIRANGGTFSKDVTDRVTHLVTTKEAFEKNVEQVQKAKCLGTVKVVTLAWLEDSLLSKSRKPKPEKPYLLETVSAKKEKKQRRAAKVQKREVDTKDKRTASKDPFANTSKPRSAASNYHVYVDEGTGVNFSTTINRQLHQKKSREKYQVKTAMSKHLCFHHKLSTPQVYESNKAPHKYATHCKYSRVGKSTNEFLAPLGSDLGSALAAFRSFLIEKTGKEWVQRFDGNPVPLKVDDDGKELPAHENWFQYEDGRSILSRFLGQGDTSTPVASSEVQQVECNSIASQPGHTRL